MDTLVTGFVVATTYRGSALVTDLTHSSRAGIGGDWAKDSLAAGISVGT